MERETLKQFLCAGPSRRLDVAGVSRRLAAAGEPGARLFSTRFLNDSILLKFLDLNPGGERRKRAIRTLIYLPFDVASPADGGESSVFTEVGFRNLCEFKACGDAAPGGDLDADIEKLRILDSLPTFSPFIVDLAFRRAGMRVPSAYLRLGPELRRTIAEHLDGRLRPLVVAACRGVPVEIDAKVAGLVGGLLSMDDPDGFRPLIQALRLPPELTRAVLTSWIGISYFECEFATLQPSVRKLENWLQEYRHRVDPPAWEDRALVAGLVTSIRRRIRDDWNEIVTISGTYRSSYDALVEEGESGPFVSFLRDSRDAYRRMGEVLGELEHAVLAWRHFDRPVRGRRLSNATAKEMLGVLADLLGDDPAGAPPLDAE